MQRFLNDSIGSEQARAATELAYAGTISYNRKNMKHELQNKGRQQNKMQSRGKRREEEVLKTVEM